MVRVARLALALVTWFTTVRSHAEAPAPDEARRAQVVAQGEGFTVTLGELEDALAQQGPLARIRYRKPDDLKGVVQALVRDRLLAAEAKRRNYASNPAVRQTVKESAAQALVRIEVEDKITPQSIPLEEVRTYYEAHPAEFHRVAMRRASQIVLASKEDAEQLASEAAKADARAFSELAKQRSTDGETKAQGGDLGYFAETAQGEAEANVDPALRKAAFALAQIGDTSAPLRVGDSYAIVRLTGERAERHASLDDAAPSIRAKLWREQRQQALDALIATLRARDKPQVFAERIQLISFDDMEKRPSGFAPDPAPADAGKHP